MMMMTVVVALVVSTTRTRTARGGVLVGALKMAPLHHRSVSVVRTSAILSTTSSSTARWMTASGEGAAVKGEKTEEEKAAIKAAREARK